MGPEHIFLPRIRRQAQLNKYPMLLWSAWLEVKLQVAKSTAKCIYCHTASTNSPADKGESERFRRTKWYFKLSLCRNWSALDLHWGNEVARLRALLVFQQAPFCLFDAHHSSASAGWFLYGYSQPLYRILHISKVIINFPNKFYMVGVHAPVGQYAKSPLGHRLRKG